MPPDLKLPQNCTEEELAERQSEIDEGKELYEFVTWAGYPPSIKKVPFREIPIGAALKLVESGFKLLGSKVIQHLNRIWWAITHIFQPKGPFDEYTALYGSRLPEIGNNDTWQFDAVFAEQRLAGMYPWFIRRVTDLAAFQTTFPINDEMIAGLVPAGTTLQDLQSNGRLYFVSQASLDGATPAHGHVMTAPTTLFYVSAVGQLMPLAMQLYPTTSGTNPVFTPNDDPETWLAVKTHASCADTLVHSIYSHAVLMHFVMCNMWTSANRTLPSEHPVHAFLKPHFWGSLFVTDAVKGSMDKITGDQCKVYGTGIIGQNEMVTKLYQGFDFREYDPNFDFAQRGVDKPIDLPEFHYRDDALLLWAADREYVTGMMGLFYTNDADVMNDTELQKWAAEMADPIQAGIVGLPVDGQGKIATRKDLIDLLTSILFTVTSRHSSIENGALKYIYTPANPFLYRLPAPTSSSQPTTIDEVADNLPSVDDAIHGNSLIATADFDHQEFGQLGIYESDFTDGWPDGVQAIIDTWRAALQGISVTIDARNENLQNPYTAMNPVNTFNSIWN